MLFRRDPPPTCPSFRRGLAVDSIRRRNASADGPNGQRRRAVQRPATLVKPLDAEKSPPPLAAKYPEADRPASSRRSDSIDLLLPATGSRTHKIVDGDTLAALAQRYLGSATRAREIFDANRNVLSDPELLPIGADLKIPPSDGAAIAAVSPASVYSAASAAGS